MVFNGLRLEYALDNNSNYIAWKDRMEAVLEDNGLKDFIHQEIPKPAVANAQELAEWKKCVVNARQILLEGVQDLESPWEGDSVFNVEDIEGPLSEE